MDGYSMDMDGRQLSYGSIIWGIVSATGWYVVGIALCLWYVSPYIKEKYLEWKRKRDEQEYAAKYHKDPSAVQERLSMLDASRQRMQEEYCAKSALAREKDEERKQKKRDELERLQVNSHGRRLGDGTLESSSSDQRDRSKSFKPEYNPLMGDGSRGYRPPKRTCCGKGGCG